MPSTLVNVLWNYGGEKILKPKAKKDFHRRRATVPNYSHGGRCGCSPRRWTHCKSPVHTHARTHARRTAAARRKPCARRKQRTGSSTQKAARRKLCAGSRAPEAANRKPRAGCLFRLTDPGERVRERERRREGREREREWDLSLLII